MKTYPGCPCKSCGSTEKYISCDLCVVCTRKRSRKRQFDPSTLQSRVNATKKWRGKFPEKVQQQRIRVRDYQAAYQSGRRAKIHQQTPTTANTQSILQIYQEARRLTQDTGIQHEVDHIIPICRGGHHHEHNLQILTMTDNRKKGGRI
jgi:5-methylcytosine-specific restriction endonuclease McrA